MKQLLRLFAFLLLAMPLLAACAGDQPQPVSNPDGPVVQVYHPPT